MKATSGPKSGACITLVFTLSACTMDVMAKKTTRKKVTSSRKALKAVESFERLTKGSALRALSKTLRVSKSATVYAEREGAFVARKVTSVSELKRVLGESLAGPKQFKTFSIPKKKKR